MSNYRFLTLLAFIAALSFASPHAVAESTGGGTPQNSSSNSTSSETVETTTWDYFIAFFCDLVGCNEEDDG